MWRSTAACLLLVSLVVLTNGAPTYEETYERALRTLRAFSQLKQAAEERKREYRAWEEEELESRSLDEKFDCKKDGEKCRGVPSCCGESQCYWPDGFSLKNDGVCVDCVRENNTCQRDKQCCAGMHCEKGGTLHVDGYCTTPGARCEGAVGEGQKCRKDSQCCNGPDLPYLFCDKYSWYHLDGKCGRSRREGRCHSDGQCVTECVKKWYQVYGVCT